MDTIFMNFKDSKTSDPDYYSILQIKQTQIKVINMMICKTLNLKYQIRHRIKNLNYLMDHISKVTLNIS